VPWSFHASLSPAYLLDVRFVLDIPLTPAVLFDWMPGAAPTIFLSACLLGRHASLTFDGNLRLLIT